ncbi:MAG: Ig domain-containing protein [Bacilli bacterium]|nr:Ig domain-containing protein [Bacilli bacterium]
MYTEYNSQNVYQNNENNYNNYSNDQEKPNRFLTFLWKILLVIIILIVVFLLLIKFGVISLASDVVPDVVILSKNEIGIKKGKSYQLEATVLPEEATNKQVIWTSSDPSIVEVNEVSGYVKGLKVGTAIVTVKTLINDKISECIVNVSDKNVLVTNINVNEKYINLGVGYRHNLTYRTIPTNATELSLNFSSSDSSVATVSDNGVITGIKEGSAIITVASNNGLVKDTTYVTVYKKGASNVVNGESIKTTNYPSSINISDESINLKLGTTSQLIATVSPSDANQEISWSSSNSNVAVVDSNGLITARGAGTATIIGRTVNNLMDTCVVTVGNYSLTLKGISVTTDYTVLPINTTKQLVVAFNPSNATNKTVTWSSSNSKVATVDSSGNVKAVGAGSTIITAKSNDGGYTDTVSVEVVDYANLVEEKTLSFTNSTYSIGVNQTVSLEPVITPSNATFKSVGFVSSDPTIAVVDENGVVTGKKEGKVTITATTKRNNIKASVVVNVKVIPSTGVSLNSTNVTISLNDTYTLIANVKPSNATNKTVKFKSDNSNVAKVDNNGIITAVGKGTTTITVTPNGGGNPSTCMVVVK